MDCIENVMHGVKCSSTQKFSDTLQRLGWGKSLKSIVIHLLPTKNNKINIYHSDAQNNGSYTGSYKRFLIHYGLC